MDLMYSAPVHVDAALLMDTIDANWASETLPVEDIEVPADAMPHLDEDDAADTQEADQDEKWNDLGLDQLALRIPQDTGPAPEPSA